MTNNITYTIPYTTVHSAPYTVPYKLPYTIPYKLPYMVSHNVTPSVSYNTASYTSASSAPYTTASSAPYKIPHKTGNKIGENGLINRLANSATNNIANSTTINSPTINSTTINSTTINSTTINSTTINSQNKNQDLATSNSFSSLHCNNCGMSGHSFNNCKFPITSVGIIAYRYNVNKQLEYLLIRRKDTIGYIEFMRGKYAINNTLYIKNLLSEMTITERARLLDNDFDTLWYKLWGDFVNNQFRSEEKNARDKFDALRLCTMNNHAQEIREGGNNCILNNLIKEVITQWREPEWGFPKGRHNNLEKDLNCGLREFEEETGYSTHSIKVIQNLMPYEEIFTGSNYKSYKHKYYVGQIELAQHPNKSFQANEISKIEWCTVERAKELIRPYNLEKLNVLDNVNMVLRKYTTF